jgi:hypothetical protein
MIARKYLVGLEDANDWDIPGIFGVYDAPRARYKGGYRILCSYADGQSHKKTIFAKLSEGGQKEDPKTWQLHHVVERQHYADIDFSGKLPFLYLNELSCVLLSEEEHRVYNGVLHCGETTDLFRDGTLPAEVIRRSEKTAKAAMYPSQRKRLQDRADQMLRLYENFYGKGSILAIVARNVINFAKGTLK